MYIELRKNAIYLKESKYDKETKKVKSSSEYLGSELHEAEKRLKKPFDRILLSDADHQKIKAELLSLRPDYEIEKALVELAKLQASLKLDGTCFVIAGAVATIQNQKDFLKNARTENAPLPKTKKCLHFCVYSQDNTCDFFKKQFEENILGIPLFKDKTIEELSCPVYKYKSATRQKQAEKPTETATGSAKKTDAILIIE